MASKDLTLRDCDVHRAQMLVNEIGKVRCWLAGFEAGRTLPGQMTMGLAPGQDALRQVQIILKDAIEASKRRSAKA